MPIQYAGEYSLDKCILLTSGGIRVDLKDTVVQVDLFEEIYKTGVFGTITVADTNGIIQNAQVIGQDYLRLKLSTPGLDERDADKFTIDFSENPLVVTKINARFDVSKGGEVFQLSFMSQEVLHNYRLKLSRSFTEINSNIVENILRSPNILDSRKKLHIEDTIGIRRHVVPNLSPFDFISTLLDDSISKVNGSPHYYFFENTKGFHFRTLQSLYNQPVTAFFNDGDAGTVLNEGKTRDIEKEFNTALSYEPSSQNDMLANIMGGMLGSTFIEYNLFHKKYAIKEYGYFDNFRDFERVNAKTISRDNPIYSEGSVDDSDNNVGDFKSARIFLQPNSINESNQGDASHYNTNTTSYSFSPNNKSKSISHNMAKMFELNSTISATMQVNGHCNLSVGNIVHVSRPAGGPGDIDEEFSGKFLITKLRHIFDQGTRKHEVLMHVAKDSSVGVDNGPVKQIKGRNQPTIRISEY